MNFKDVPDKISNSAIDVVNTETIATITAPQKEKLLPVFLDEYQQQTNSGKRQLTLIYVCVQTLFNVACLIQLRCAISIYVMYHYLSRGIY